MAMVLQAEGYDPVTRVMYSPSTKFEFVPDRPSQNEVIEARERLLDLVVDFPFAQPVHRNAWLAGLLTFFARPAYDGATPFFSSMATCAEPERVSCVTSLRC